MLMRSGTRRPKQSAGNNDRYIYNSGNIRKNIAATAHRSKPNSRIKSINIPSLNNLLHGLSVCCVSQRLVTQVGFSLNEIKYKYM